MTPTPRRFAAVIGTAAALLGSVEAAHAADAGLAARYDLDAATPAGGSAWQVADSSGNALNATGSLQPTLVTGKWGNAVRFGTNRALTVPDSLPASAGLEPPTGTLSLWFKASADPGEVKFLVAKGAPDACESASYALYTGFAGDGTPAAPRNVGLQGYYYDGTDTTFTSLAPGNPWDGGWHAAAVVFSNGFAKLYTDGVLRGSRGIYPFTNPTFDIGAPRYDALPFTIGGLPNPACGDRTFNGTIDEVRFYSRALSDGEIARLHDAASPTPPDVDPPVQPPAPEAPPPAPPIAAPPAVTPLPTLGATSVLSWKLLRSGRTTLTGLLVEGVRDGDHVSIDCKGPGCKKKTNRAVALTKVKKGRYRLNAAVKGLSLKPKATLTVTIARAGFASRVISYRTVSRRDPKRESRCQTPGAKTTYVC